MAESGDDVTAAKRRRTFSEGEKPKLVDQQRIVPAAEPTTQSSDVKTDGDGSSESTKRVADGEQALSRKDRKRKRAGVRSASEQEAELAAKTARADDALTSCQDAVDDSGMAAKLCRACEDSTQCSAENVNPSVKKQKRVGKPKKEKKCKNRHKPEPPRLRVISKSVAV